MDPSTALWLVVTEAAPGREQEYDAWLDAVHLPEVTATPGIRSARRYRDDGGRFLTVYEVDGDPEAVRSDVGRRMGAGEITRSDLLDPASLTQGVWRPRHPEV